MTDDYRYNIGETINKGNCTFTIIKQYSKPEKKIQKYKNNIWYDVCCDGCENCGKTFKITDEALSAEGSICLCISGTNTKNYKLNVGEKLFDDKRKFEILDRYIIIEYRSGRYLRVKHYKVKCHDCGQCYDKTESLLCNGNCGCQCNSPNNSIVFGYNDLYSLRPDLHKYFVNVDDAKHLRPSSVEYVKLKCPNCGQEKTMRTNTLTKDGFSCGYCSDGLSYPNKFLYCFLDQLGVKYKPEFSPSWANKKRYDAEFIKNDKEYVVEMDGSFHYDTGRKGEISKNKLQETIESDKEKNILAQKNGVIMIRIPSYPQKREIIQRNLQDSIFSKLFDLSVIDWEKCDLFASSSMLVKICNYYNSHPNLPMEEYEKAFNLGHSAINKYLNKGYNLGICTYYSRNRLSADRRKIIFDAINNDPYIPTGELLKLSGLTYTGLQKHINYGVKHGLINWKNHNDKAREIEDKVRNILLREPNIRMSKLARMTGYSEGGIKDVVRRVKENEQPNLSIL